MGFKSNLADIWFNPQVILFDQFVFNNVLFEFELRLQDSGTHIFALTQTIER